MKLAANDTMTHELITIDWCASMTEARDLMTKARVRHLPVVDDFGHMVGMLSDRDVARAMKAESEGFVLGQGVRHFMSWPVKTVERSSDLRQVAGEMVASKISSVVVKDGSRYVGIITTEDLLKVLMGILEQPNLRMSSTVEHSLRPF